MNKKLNSLEIKLICSVQHTHHLAATAFLVLANVSYCYNILKHLLQLPTTHTYLYATHQEAT